ncbi:MAG: penicillin-binding protein 2 [Magnetococcales bacterium]|nr:penicillin-binding protein 2 [Magnetococcales bacterium]
MLPNENEQFFVDARRRLVIIGAGNALLFSVIGGRLFHLQVMKGGDYRDLAENNRISLQPVPALRGRILGRHGQILVENSPDYRLMVTPELSGGLERLLQRLKPFLDMSSEEIHKVLDQARRQSSFLPLNVKSHLTWAELSRIEARIHTFPGTTLQIQSLRHYPFGPLAAHVLGYMGSVNDKDRKKFPHIPFRSGDLVGKTGMERRHESNLRGVEGIREVEVNALGRQVRELNQTPPTPGEDLHLTLDTDLQRDAEEAIGDNAGAVVAMNPNTGEILAMTSQPAYDPNQFIRGFSGKQWRKLVNDRRRPLSNKAIGGQYPPGSTFKIVVALAALADEKVDSGERFYCGGHITRQDHRFYCWKRRGHGRMDLKQALAQSCDVYFYRLAEKVGINAIERFARRLGLGDSTGLDLAGERSGLVPSRSWKRARYGKPWYPGETLISAIGQGYMLATPLQLANMIATIANGGTLFRPSLIRHKPNQLPEVLGFANLNQAHLALVKDGLEEVLNGPMGTALKARPEHVRAAGKTGTSQVVRHRRKESGKVIKSDNPLHRDHALFVAYAPVDQPEIAISIVVEHGGSGASTAAPVAKSILDRYFARKAAAQGLGEGEGGGDGQGGA